MSNLRDAIVHMALRRPYLYLLVTLVISIVLMEVLVEIAEHTFIKPALQQLELQFIAYVQQFVTPPLTAEVMLVTASGSSTFYLLASALKAVTVFPAVTLWERFVFMASWHILQDWDCEVNRCAGD